MLSIREEEDTATGLQVGAEEVHFSRDRSESMSSAVSDDSHVMPRGVSGNESFAVHRKIEQPLRMRARRNSEDPNAGRMAVRDEYGWAIATDMLISSRVDGKQAQAAAWARILASNDLSRCGRMKEAVRLGIPSGFRPAAWFLHSGAQDIFDAGLYGSLVQSTITDRLVPFEEHFPYLFPTNAIFHPQSSVFLDDCEGRKPPIYDGLRRVLRAAMRHTATPYSLPLCQIVGFVLVAMREEEERTFWIVVALLRSICPLDLLQDTLTQGFVDREAFCGVMRQRMPRLWDHLAHLDVPVSLIVASWMQQLFVDLLPASCTIRMFDSLFYEGFKVVHRVCLSVFRLSEHALMQCSTAQDATAILRLAVTRNIQDAFELMETAFQRIGSLPMALVQKERRTAEMKLAQLASVRRFSVSGRRMSVMK